MTDLWVVTGTSKDLRGKPKPQVPPDWPGPKPVRGQGIFLKIFSGRVGEFYFGSVWVGVFFYRGVRHFLPGFRG